MKSVLITGASSGIGKQLAQDYANDGWNVIACGQNKARLISLVESIEANYQKNITTLAFDITDVTQTKMALAQLSTFPQVIILNAGTCEYINHGEIDSALFKRVFDVNVFGTLYCLEALQSRFTSETHVVFISSSASYISLPRAEAYGASKAAITYLANTLALDLAYKNITITLVNPGFVSTPLTKKNDFTMPMIVTSAYASTKIRQGIAAKKAEIHFPIKFTLLLKAIALLPITLQRILIKKMIGTSS